MRFLSILSWIGVASLACLNGAAAAPFDGNASYHQLSKRAPLSYCSGDQNVMLDAALKEVTTMVGVTAGRTRELISFLNHPEPLSVNSPQLMSTLRTFESVYGQTYFGNGDPNNGGGLRRVEEVYRKTSELWSSLLDLNNKNIQIFCDDSWLTDVSADEYLPDTPLTYFDGRPVGSTRGWINLASTGGSCRQSDLAGLTIPSAVNAGTVFDAVTMCQSFMPGWEQGWNSGITLTNARQNVQPAGTLISAFSKIFSTTLLHELTHCGNLYPNNEFYVDHSCNMGGTSTTAYGWDCIYSLGQQDPERSMGNADSFMFYSIAMFLDKNNWYTGLAQPMG